MRQVPDAYHTAQVVYGPQGYRPACLDPPYQAKEVCPNAWPIDQRAAHYDSIRGRTRRYFHHESLAHPFRHRIGILRTGGVQRSVRPVGESLAVDFHAAKVDEPAYASHHSRTNQTLRTQRIGYVVFV